MGASSPESAWPKSTYSVGDGACVEVFPSGPSILVRDSLDRSGPVLTIGMSSWTALVAWIKGNSFDRDLPSGQ